MEVQHFETVVQYLDNNTCLLLLASSFFRPYVCTIVFSPEVIELHSVTPDRPNNVDNLRKQLISITAIKIKNDASSYPK